jgi:hypothetical protein
MFSVGGVAGDLEPPAGGLAYAMVLSGDSPSDRRFCLWLGAVSKLGFSFVGKENKPAMREYTLLVFDRHGGRSLTMPTNEKTI